MSGCQFKKQLEWRGRRQDKTEFIFYQRNSQFSRSVQYANGSKNVVTQAKYAMMTGKDEKLAVVASDPQTTQNLVISRCCFAEDGKEMYKDL